MKQNKLYNVAIYCRLSLDDGNEGDSSSIKTQKIMLEEYVKEKGFNIYDYYIDDGYSGLNFNRPAFKRMIKDIEAGFVNLVITKDLSRLGRDYIMTGYYNEIFFPSHDVRYISINDNVDTLYDNIVEPTRTISPTYNGNVSWLYYEIQYLIDKGYQWLEDLSALVRG